MDHFSRDDPSKQCPICSSLSPDKLHFGPDAPVANYTIDLHQSAQNVLRKWQRSCVLANIAYRLSSIWLGRDSPEEVRRKAIASIPYSRTRGSYHSKEIKEVRHRRHTRHQKSPEINHHGFLLQILSQPTSLGSDDKHVYYHLYHTVTCASLSGSRILLSTEHGRHIEPSPACFRVQWFLTETLCEDVPFIDDVQYIVVHQHALRDPSRLRLLDWIRQCDEGHACYKKTGFLPSRLLDVRDLANIRLLESADFHDSGGAYETQCTKYAALSHCWGTSRDFLTTRMTISSMKKGFGLSRDVPQTFIDAITATHTLLIPFLWIDSLCIIQDDEDDWAAEASRMADVYSNSYLTIAAASSSDDRAGFLSPRPFRYATVEFTAPPTGGYKDRGCFRVYLHKENERTNASHAKSPLFSRAWVLQEQFLSPRTMTFDNVMATWNCDKQALTEEDSRQNGAVFFDSPRYYAAADYKHYWVRVLQDFSRRVLTYPTDALPATSGMASVFATFSHIDERQGYCAGLWMCDLPKDLMFERQEVAAQRPVEYIAPSWSWAALPGPVLWPMFERYPHLEPLLSIKVTSCDIRLKHPGNPYGRVEEGSSLTIMAHPVRLRYWRTTTKWQRFKNYDEIEYILASCSDDCDGDDREKNFSHEWQPRDQGQPDGLRAQCKFDVSETNTQHELVGLILAAGVVRTIDDNLDADGFEKMFPEPLGQAWTELHGILVFPELLNHSTIPRGYRRIGVFSICGLKHGRGKDVVDACGLQEFVLY